jgi:hypothetical protein
MWDCSRSICHSPWQSSQIGARIQCACFNPKRGLISLIYAADRWETQYVQRIWDPHSQRVEATWRNEVNKFRRCSQEHFANPESNRPGGFDVRQREPSLQCWVSNRGPKIWTKNPGHGWNTTQPLGVRANKALNRQREHKDLSWRWRYVQCVAPAVSCTFIVAYRPYDIAT